MIVYITQKWAKVIASPDCVKPTWLPRALQRGRARAVLAAPLGLGLGLGWFLRQQLRQLRWRRERVASVHARAGGSADKAAAAAAERPAQREDAPREQRCREADQRHLVPGGLDEELEGDEDEHDSQGLRSRALSILSILSMNKTRGILGRDAGL